MFWQEEDGRAGERESKAAVWRQGLAGSSAGYMERVGGKMREKGRRKEMGAEAVG